MSLTATPEFAYFRKGQGFYRYDTSAVDIDNVPSDAVRITEDEYDEMAAAAERNAESIRHESAAQLKGERVAVLVEALDITEAAASAVYDALRS